jgi:hypothetical protein
MNMKKIACAILMILLLGSCINNDTQPENVELPHIGQSEITTRELFIKDLIENLGIQKFAISQFWEKGVETAQISKFSDLQVFSEEEDFEKAEYVYTAVMHGIIQYADFDPTYEFGEEWHDPTGEWMCEAFPMQFLPEQPVNREEVAIYIARGLSLSTEEVSATGILDIFSNPALSSDRFITLAQTDAIMEKIRAYLGEHPLREKTFEKMICFVESADFSVQDKFMLEATPVQRATIKRSKWEKLKNGDTLVINKNAYYVIENMEQKWLSISKEAVYPGIFICYSNWEDEEYFFSTCDYHGSFLYENVGETYSLPLDAFFVYFDTDNDGYVWWFKAHQNDTVIANSPVGKTVTIWIVDGKAKFIFDVYFTAEPNEIL